MLNFFKKAFIVVNIVNLAIQMNLVILVNWWFWWVNGDSGDSGFSFDSDLWMMTLVFLFILVNLVIVVNLVNLLILVNLFILLNLMIAMILMNLRIWRFWLGMFIFGNSKQSSTDPEQKNFFSFFYSAECGILYPTLVVM